MIPSLSNPSILPSTAALRFELRNLRLEQLFLYLCAASTLLAEAGEIAVAGFACRGWAWALLLGASTLLLIPSRLTGRIRCAWWLWLPWIGWMVLKTDFHSRDAAQRFFIFLTPPVTLWVASSFHRVTPEMLQRAYRLLWSGSLLLYVLAVLHSGSPRALADWYSIAGIAMTFTLLGAEAIARMGSSRIGPWLELGLCLVIMFVTESRMPVFVLPAILLLGCSRLSWSRRVLIGVAGGILGIALFYTTPVQESLFHDGYGTLGQLLTLDRNAVNLSGRLEAWPEYLKGIENPWLGDGSTASAEFGHALFGATKWAHPHNEYIRILFDYGLVGVILLGVPTASLLITLLVRRLRARDPSARTGYSLAFNGLLAMLLLGISGNSLMYVAYIGNMLFATIGCTYASQSHTPEDTTP